MRSYSRVILTLTDGDLVISLPADTVSSRAVGSVVGFGGMAGAVGGMLMAEYAGQVLGKTGSYSQIFAVIGVSYLVALGVIHLILPRMEWTPDE